MASTPTLWTVAFWKASGERAIKTAAQTALVLIPTLSVGIGADLRYLDWGLVASGSAGGALLSILTSIVSDAATGGGPSLTTEVIDEDDQP